MEENKLNCFCFAGLFCHHVIAVFEHLRLDEIPRKYILQRYTKDAVTDPEYNRSDYKTTATDGTSLEYRRTMLYNEAMKTLNRGLESDKLFDAAMSAFREVNLRMDNAENLVDNSDKTATSDEAHATPDRPEGARENPAEEQASADDPPFDTSGEGEHQESGITDKYAHIQAPPKAKTVGSKSKAKDNKNKQVPAPAPTPTRPQPELDENGKPKGQRLCTKCNMIDGHNARTCEKRQLMKQLMEAHERLYGKGSSAGLVKQQIKKLIEKQHVQEEEDDIVDGDEEEDYDEYTDDDGEDTETGEDTDAEDTDAADTGADDEDSQPEEPGDTAAEDEGSQPEETPADILNGETAQGRRTCSICNLKQGHNARKCPNEKRIMEERRAAAQNADNPGQIMTAPIGKRTCSICGEMAGHNSRSCLRKQLEAKLKAQLENYKQQGKAKKQPQQRQNKQEDHKKKKEQQRKQTKTKNDTTPPEQPRRSNRFL